MSRWPEIVELHRALLADRVRTESFRRAILATVRPGDVVLDVGAGTGVLAGLAARAGARRVYAIEAADVVDIARQVTRQNGLDDRVVFLHDRAERVDLPEPVDVIVTETLGNFGVNEGILGIGIDTRTRFLREGGRIIPRAVELFVAPVEAPEVYAEEIGFWADDLYGLDFSPVRALAVNTVHIAIFQPETFLAEPASLARADLLAIDSADVHGEAMWRARRAGTLHGFGGWFAADLADGLRLSNAPPLTTPNWRHAFLPLERPVAVEAGERVSVAISALANGTVWTWRTVVADRACGDQSTLWGVPRLRQRLRGVASDSAPALTRHGEAERHLLDLVDGRTPLRELAEKLQRHYPDFFHTWDDVLAFAQDVIARCAR